MPSIEYVKFPASDAYIQDHSVAKPLFDLISVEEGFISVHYGLLHEDTKIGIFNVVWETYEHHKKFMDSPNYYETKALMAPSISSSGHGSFQMKHVATNADPSAALTAPIIEVTRLKPKEGKVKEALENLHEYVEVLSVTKGVYPPPAWGEIREDPGEYYVFVGCESVGIHFGEKKLKAVADKLKDTCELNVEHITPSTVDPSA